MEAAIVVTGLGALCHVGIPEVVVTGLHTVVAVLRLLAVSTELVLLIEGIAEVRLLTVAAILGLLAEGVTETEVTSGALRRAIAVRVRLERILEVTDVFDDVFDELLPGHLAVLGTLRDHGLECVEVEAHLVLVGTYAGVGGEGGRHSSSHGSVIDAVHLRNGKGVATLTV